MQNGVCPPTRPGPSDQNFSHIALSMSRRCSKSRDNIPGSHVGVFRSTSVEIPFVSCPLDTLAAPVQSSTTRSERMHLLKKTISIRSIHVSCTQRKSHVSACGRTIRHDVDMMSTYVDICHHDVVQTIRSDSGDVAGCRHHHRTSHTCMRITPMTRVKHAPLWYVHNHNETIIEPLPGRRYRREKQARSFVNWPVGGPI